MWIKKICLTNWRAYEHAVFDIPRGDPKANIVIIGAENGKGKTSLLEAITCCLFGKDGASYLRRASNNHYDNHYDNFISAAFCQFADMSSPKASVELVFDVGGTHEISVKRIWHFGTNRQYKHDSDELFIKEDGEDLDLPPPSSDTIARRSRETYLKGYITEKFMPPVLSSFFLFDGGQVQQLAQQHMTQQVKLGIEGILGVSTLQELITDFHDYANQRRNQGRRGRALDEEFEKLKSKLSDAESQSRHLVEKLEKIEKDLVNVTTEENALLKQYIDMGGDDVAKLGELREQEGKLQQEGIHLFNALSDALVGDFAMSLAGTDILASSAERLRAEKARVDWERDKTVGGEKYEKFIANLKQMDAFALPLSEKDIATLRDNLNKAWNEVWYPMPDSCAKNLFNPTFSNEERISAEGRLRELSGASLAKIKDLRDKISRNEQDIVDIKQRISASGGGQSEPAQLLLEKYKDKRNESLTLAKTKAADERDKAAVDNDLARLRQEMGREIETRKGNDPLLHQSAEAEKSVKMLEEIISDAYSSHVKDIARAMTSSYLSMAHKGVVNKIEITDKCDVRLLDKKGNNIRELDPSHGESEIFSLALIAAITRVSKNRFPLIIDTPLANLDEKHRREFLHHFSSSIDNQILFLSTNEEIREEQIRTHRYRIAQTFLVEQKSDNGHRKNVVNPGQYFWDIDS